MIENPDINWYSMSDKALQQFLGVFIRSQRLSQNKTQQEVADNAGIVRSTLVLMENGRGGTLTSFIQILRTLEQLDLLKQFEVRNQISPLLLAKQERDKRQRSRSNKNTGGNELTKSNW